VSGCGRGGGSNSHCSHCRDDSLMEICIQDTEESVEERGGELIEILEE
jgi:hypothetical protein